MQSLPSLAGSVSLPSVRLPSVVNNLLGSRSKSTGGGQGGGPGGGRGAAGGGGALGTEAVEACAVLFDYTGEARDEVSRFVRSFENRTAVADVASVVALARFAAAQPLDASFGARSSADAAAGEGSEEGAAGGGGGAGEGEDRSPAAEAPSVAGEGGGESGGAGEGGGGGEGESEKGEAAKAADAVKAAEAAKAATAAKAEAAAKAAEASKAAKAAAAAAKVAAVADLPSGVDACAAMVSLLQSSLAQSAVADEARGGTRQRKMEEHAQLQRVVTAQLDDAQAMVDADFTKRCDELRAKAELDAQADAARRQAALASQLREDAAKQAALATKMKEDARQQEVLAETLNAKRDKVWHCDIGVRWAGFVGVCGVHHGKGGVKGRWTLVLPDMRAGLRGGRGLVCTLVQGPWRLGP